MRVIASGIADFSLQDFVELKEHSYEISENLLRKVLLTDSYINLKPLLKEMHDYSRNGEKTSVRVLLDVLRTMPLVNTDLEKVKYDLLLKPGIELSETLTSPKFDELFKQILKPVIRGSLREEVFNSRIARLLPASSSITILDRFLVSQMTRNDFKNSGAYWLLNKFVESGTRNIEILSSKTDRDSKDGFVNLDILKNRLGELLGASSFKTRIYCKVGFSPHDRHISFRFSQGRGEQSITLGGGSDVFKFDVLDQGYSLVALESETALNNEQQVLDSKGREFDIRNY